MVSSSKTLSHRVLASTSSPSRIVYSQTQEYTLKLTKKKKVIQSMVVIHLDNDDKITMLEDKWRGDDQPSSWAAKVCFSFLHLSPQTSWSASRSATYVLGEEQPGDYRLLRSSLHFARFLRSYWLLYPLCPIFRLPIGIRDM